MLAIYGLASAIKLLFQERLVFALLLAQGISATVLDHDAEMI